MKIKKLLFWLIALFLFTGSISATYFHTRTKWFELGQHSGEITGMATALDIVCGMASSGQPHAFSDAQLVVKSGIATFVRRGDLVEIRCE